MLPRFKALGLVGGLAVACGLCAPAHSASLKLYPVRIVLDPAEPIQTMTIQNEDQAPARVQLRVFEWKQENGEDVFKETRDIIANPPLFEIPASGEQIARFGLRTQPGAIEKSYRLFLEEVPSQEQLAPGEVRTLLRISVPIFVPAPDAKAEVEWRLWPSGSGRATLSAHNSGSAHIQLHKIALTLKGRQVASKDMSIYILPGTSQTIELEYDAPARAGQNVTLGAQTDQGDISAHIVSEMPPNAE